MMKRFESDYLEGAHPDVLRALIETNGEQAPGYGEDSHCEAARALLRERCALPEGEVQFEISDLDEAFQVGDMDFSEEEKNQNHPEKEFSEPENFIPVQEEGEENLSGSSLHSRNISTGQEKGSDAGQREQERPSVRRELENIKREKAEESQKRSREKNRGPRKTQKKARNKRKVKAR